MNYFPLTKQQQEWQERAADIAARELGPRAEEIDQKAQYPQASLDALKREGLFGLRVSKEHGGLGEDMLTTSLIIEELSKKCPSTSMCYKMHLEAAEIISRIPTPYQVEHFVEPMARADSIVVRPRLESVNCVADIHCQVDRADLLVGLKVVQANRGR